MDDFDVKEKVEVLEYLIDISRVIEEYPSLCVKFIESDLEPTNYYDDNRLTPTRQKIIRSLYGDMAQGQPTIEDYTKYKQTINLSMVSHVGDNFDKLRFDLLDFNQRKGEGELCELFHHLENYFSYNFLEKHLYVTTIIGAIDVIGGTCVRSTFKPPPGLPIKRPLPVSRGYEHMYMLLYMSECSVLPDIPEALHKEIIHVCHITYIKKKDLYVRLFLRAIQSLMEWSEGKGGKQKKSVLSGSTDFIDTFDHDWLKLCSHGLYILDKNNRMRDAEWDLDMKNRTKIVNNKFKKIKRSEPENMSRSTRTTFPSESMDVETDLMDEEVEPITIGNNENLGFNWNIETAINCSTDEDMVVINYVSPIKQTYCIGLGNKL